jgi:hypothetical protein
MQPDPEPAALEQGRDLTLLALALVLINEGMYIAWAVFAEQIGFVAQAGRFTMLAAMCYMTWQGFTLSRWILILLVCAAILAAPLALSQALGSSPFVAVLVVIGAAGYVVAAWLLIRSQPVAAFLRHRRDLRDSEILDRP